MAAMAALMVEREIDGGLLVESSLTHDGGPTKMVEQLKFLSLTVERWRPFSSSRFNLLIAPPNKSTLPVEPLTDLPFGAYGVLIW